MAKKYRIYKENRLPVIQDAVGEPVVPVQLIDLSGNPTSGGGGGGGGVAAAYVSPSSFVGSYYDGGTISISGGDEIVDSASIVAITAIDTVTKTSTSYFQGIGGTTLLWDSANQRIEVYSSGVKLTTFNSNMVFSIGVNGAPIGSDPDLNAIQMVRLDSPTKLETDIYIDTTNLAVATYNYPASDGDILIGKDPSFQVKLIGGTGTTLTLTFERTDEDDTITSPAKWYDCTRTATVSATGTVTSGAYSQNGTGYTNFVAAPGETIDMCVDFDGFRGKRIRATVVVSGGAVNTVYISRRQELLEA